MNIIEKIVWKRINKKQNSIKCPWCGKYIKGIAEAHGTWWCGYSEYKCKDCDIKITVEWGSKMKPKI